MAGFHAGKQTVAAELLVAHVPRFSDAVAAHEHQITGLELERACLVGRVSKQAEDEPARFERAHLGASDNDRWFVTGDAIAQRTSG